MLKKLVLNRLLPLLFSFCFVFSGFLSVNAFADTISIDYTSTYTYADGLHITSFKNGSIDFDTGYIVNDNPIGSTNLSEAQIDNVYKTPHNHITYQLFYLFTNPWDFVYLPELYDYYFVFGHYSSVNNFSADKIYLYYRNVDSPVNVPFMDCNFTTYDITGLNRFGHTYSFKIEPNNFSSINGISLLDADGGLISDTLYFWFRLVPIPKNANDDQVNSIISAINNQTTTLDGSIDEAADDIQQSIEDQYSGEPEEEFSVDDVITQHNEKMGVLSFGSDVMLQFLDMFQSANVGTAELTLPGFNITVENVEYSVWPDYSFNFEQLNEWVPALMSVIRVMLPAFVWLMVLRYCIKVFEDNFLAK